MPPSTPSLVAINSLVWLSTPVFFSIETILNLLFIFELRTPIDSNQDYIDRYPRPPSPRRLVWLAQAPRKRHADVLYLANSSSRRNYGLPHAMITCGIYQAHGGISVEPI